jgi:hypothetical protein
MADVIHPPSTHGQRLRRDEADSVEARNAAAFAISQGSPARPSMERSLMV